LIEHDPGEYAFSGRRAASGKSRHRVPVSSRIGKRPLASSDDRQIHVRLDERPRGTVAHVTLGNARNLSAMNSALMGEFVDTMARLATDERLRAVVLTGAGPKAFIVGADIGEMAGIAGGAEATAFIMRLHRCCDAVRAFPVPVIARIQGYAFGAGLEMAASCDVRIAADTALLGMPEVKLGIPSVIEAALLPMLVGWGRAREIMFFGETFTAGEALEWGLVERVVPASALDEAIEEWLGKLLTSTPRAVRLQKRLMRQWENQPLAAAVQAGIEAFAAAYETDEPAVAMREFLAAQKARKRRD
jgi:enoyl-CoA hydratase